MFRIYINIYKHIIYIDDINSSCTYRMGLHMLHVTVQGMPRIAHCPPQRKAQCLIGDVIIFLFRRNKQNQVDAQKF